ncbi:acyl-CoA thioesterase [Olivibacter sp. XZL3]|uniref:acyl-CoA thioesterase n=1 Tax=Olivibacter sp. XZL3 TaxID=1735116 RepID=UPI001065C93B|nr:acyl-CoA thioesterase [Olivibacter sp. XZL3]
MNNFKKVAESQTVMTELMIPSYSNFGGKIHGGVILSLMDKVAYVCAAKHAETYCVTASIDLVDFRASVEVGEIISLLASVNYVGNSSLVVGIKVLAENVKTHAIKHTNSSYFSMVALDEQTNKPVQVPGLILENEIEIQRFITAMHRKELNRYYKQEGERLKSDFKNQDFIEVLKKERCMLKQP